MHCAAGSRQCLTATPGARTECTPRSLQELPAVYRSHITHLIMFAPTSKELHTAVVAMESLSPVAEGLYPLTEFPESVWHWLRQEYGADRFCMNRPSPGNPAELSLNTKRTYTGMLHVARFAYEVFHAIASNNGPMKGAGLTASVQAPIAQKSNPYTFTIWFETKKGETAGIDITGGATYKRIKVSGYGTATAEQLNLNVSPNQRAMVVDALEEIAFDTSPRYHTAKIAVEVEVKSNGRIYAPDVEDRFGEIMTTIRNALNTMDNGRLPEDLDFDLDIFCQSMNNAESEF